MAEVTITPRDNGPYLNKPFCDGTHARIAFRSECRAPSP
jgi:CDGSH-type Zn-finger protein